jgi:hypothetical protein
VFGGTLTIVGVGMAVEYSAGTLQNHPGEGGAIP